MGWQPFTVHLIPFRVHSPFSEILGVGGSLNSEILEEILDLKRRIGDVYLTFPNTLQSLGQLLATSDPFYRGTCG